MNHGIEGDRNEIVLLAHEAPSVPPGKFHGNVQVILVRTRDAALVQLQHPERVLALITENRIDGQRVGKDVLLAAIQKEIPTCAVLTPSDIGISDIISSTLIRDGIPADKLKVVPLSDLENFLSSL